MRADQIFGALVVILAIYLGVTAVQSGGTAGGVFSGVDTPPFALDGAGDGSGFTFGAPSGQDGGGDSGSADVAERDTTSGDQRSNTSGTSREAGDAVVEESDFCVAASGTAAFTDVGIVHRAAVECVTAAGIVEGVSDRRFVPRDAVTRGQAAMAVAAMIDTANRLEAKGIDLRELPDAGSSRFEDFKDASADCPGERAIARLDETPVLQGYVDARFEPCGNITRAQMASLLDRAYQYMNRSALPLGSRHFTDISQSVHRQSIRAVTSAGIMKGTGNRRFRPEHSVLRGQMASYIARVLVRMEDKGRIMPLS